MSPELFNPGKFGLQDSRPTKRSDCYALGMVIYEVLSGKAPFSRYHHYMVVVKVLEGERPGKPQGMEGMWLNGDIWRILERCWRSIPRDRPVIREVLQCLETVSKSWTPPPPQTLVVPLATDPPMHSPGSSDEESIDGSEVSPSSRAGPSQQSWELLSAGDPNEIKFKDSAHEFSGFFYDVPDSQDLGMSTNNPNEQDSEELGGILDRVSWPGLLGGFWC